MTMSFDEKQRRRDKWNKKRNFKEKDRFKKKKFSFEPPQEVQEQDEEQTLDNYERSMIG